MPTTFTSSGTVRIVYGTEGERCKVLFTSATHHTIEHDRKKFAVFVNACQKKPQTSQEKEKCAPENGNGGTHPNSDGAAPLEAKVLELKDNHVEIEVGGKSSTAWRDALSQAAIRSVGVDITVVSCEGKLTLTGAVVPAKSHKK